MPPKKADSQPRKSDVSVARFVLADGPEDPSAASPTSPGGGVGSTIAVSVAPTTPSVSGGDKKDKDKDGLKDATTIEVICRRCCCRCAAAVFYIPS